MNFTFQRAALALPIIAIILATGCGTQAGHPNQINSFDGTTFDSMLMAHAALDYLQPQVAVAYPKYKPMFNQAAAAYGVAETTYAEFRSNPQTQAEAAAAVENLTVAIVALENAFLTDAGATPTEVAAVRLHAKRLRAKATHAGVSVSDILTELEIAAAIARAIPQASRYAALAQLVIGATNAALAADSAATSQPIDVGSIQPISVIQ